MANILGHEEMPLVTLWIMAAFGTTLMVSVANKDRFRVETTGPVFLRHVKSCSVWQLEACTT